MRKYGPLNTGLVETSCVDTTSTNTSNHPVKGMVVGIYIDPNFSCISTPHLKISTVSDPPVVLYDKDVDQPGWFYPSVQLSDPATGNAIANQYSEGIPIADFVRVELTEAEEGDNADIWLMLQE